MATIAPKNQRDIAASFLPIICLACQKKLMWTKNDKGVKIDLYCPNDQCPGPQLRKLDHFFTVLKVDGLSKGILKHMIEANLGTIQKILAANKKQLSNLPGFADKKITNTLVGLKELVSNVQLPKLMHASGIFNTEVTGIGSTLLAPMIKHLGRKEVLETPFKPEQMQIKLLELHGIGEERAQLFVEKLPEFRAFYKSIANLSLAAETNGGVLSGSVFCFSSFRDPELHEKLENLGGRVSNSLTKQVTTLFTSDLASTKTVKAKQLGITIIHKDAIYAFLKNL